MRHRTPPPHLKLLLGALGRPAEVVRLKQQDLDLLIRSARSAQLLGHVAALVAEAGSGASLAGTAGRQLQGALALAEYRRHLVMYEAHCVAMALGAFDAPVILLKGAAYAAQSLVIARGRLPRDLDLLVPRSALGDAERSLKGAGWVFQDDLTAYDHHYYRAWAHELPPLRNPGHAVELDLHHNILPPIGRLKPDAGRLIADSVEVPSSPFRVLRPADQVLHAAVHLFQDSDCVGRLRDLVDIDGLVRHFSAQAGESFWQQLAESTAVHGLGRPLWYALAFCRAWLDTPVPDPAWEALQAHRPPAPVGALMTALATRVLPPVHPDAEAGLADRLAASALEFRSLWLRMPPWTLAYHAASKLARSMRRSPPQADAG